MSLERRYVHIKFFMNTVNTLKDLVSFLLQVFENILQPLSWVTFFKKNILRLLFIPRSVSMHLCKGLCVRMQAPAEARSTREPGLELQTVVNCPTWVLGIKLGSCGWVGNALSQWVISPATPTSLLHFYHLYVAKQWEPLIYWATSHVAFPKHHFT